MVINMAKSKTTKNNLEKRVDRLERLLTWIDTAFKLLVFSLIAAGSITAVFAIFDSASSTECSEQSGDWCTLGKIIGFIAAFCLTCLALKFVFYFVIVIVYILMTIITGGTIPKNKLAWFIWNN